MEPIFGGAAAVLVALIAGWSARRVEQIKQQAQRNHEEIEHKRFSMDYWERLAQRAEAEAERWEREYREEQAIARAFAAGKDRAEDRLRIITQDRDYLRRWAETALRECPELGDIYPYVSEPEDVDDQDVHRDQPGHHGLGRGGGSGGELPGPGLQLPSDGEGP